MTAIDVLLQLIDEGFDHKAWHGPTLLGAIRGVTAAQAAWRPARGRHTIRELTVHAAYWKYAVRRRLDGEPRGSFALHGSNWFVDDRSRSWKDDVRLLVDEHRQLRAAVAAFPARALDAPVDAKKQTAAYTIRGIAAHDVYHAGQIQLITKLQEGRIAGLQEGRAGLQEGRAGLQAGRAGLRGIAGRKHRAR